MDVVAALGDPDQVLAVLRDQQPDLVVLDLRMPGVDGLALLQRIRAEGLDTPAVILTMSDSETDLAAALRAGVRGYLLKDMEPEDVIASIGSAARGELVVAPMMTLKLAQLLQSGPKGRTAAATCSRFADRAGARDPRPPGAWGEQQDDRPRAGHQPRHRQAPCAPHPVQAEPQLAGRGRRLRGRGAQRRRPPALSGDVRLRKESNASRRPTRDFTRVG
jgi:CheY-like chemotaxis protein